ncbi:hypothetical protein [Calycomorphotria hydatis]|uniref:hypothetical protein n=1 Tax=Calycomorphotria hydatis TaxID=2528027 RepID=UPI0018D2199D|nr:hypothetical protein [Calycomorphotria hydatis]
MKFVLEEPDEVQLELADAPPKEPVGQAPRHVPDTPAQPPQINTASAAPPAPQQPAAQPEQIPDFGAPTIKVDDDIRPSKRRRRGSKKRSNNVIVQVIAGGLGVICVFGLLFWGLSSMKAPAIEVAVKNNTPPANDPSQTTSPVSNGVIDGGKSRGEMLLDAIPGSGNPITLKYVPAGTSMVIHLHPSRFWGATADATALRQSLEPLSTWAGTRIEEIALAPPEEVDELLISLMLGALGEEPRYVAVIRYKTGRQKSALIKTMQGVRSDQYARPVYMAGDRAYLIGDEVDQEQRPLVVVSAPVDYAEELPEAIVAPGLAGRAIEAMLSTTDRSRLFTLVGLQNDLKVHGPALIPEDTLPLVRQFAEAIGDQTDSFQFNLQMSGDEFFTQLVLQPSSFANKSQYARKVHGQLEAIPQSLATLRSQLDPPEVGKHQVIEQMPTFFEAWLTSSIHDTLGSQVIYVSRLPAIAAPNIALASVLTWKESIWAAEHPQTAVAQANTPKAPTLPDKVIDRLKLPIDIEFSRTPLQEAFAYIAEESKVKIEIDGDALKFSGYTKNMPQIMTLGKAPATTAIQKIISQYDAMCVVVEEDKSRMLVTTKSFAKDQGLTPTDLNQ